MIFLYRKQDAGVCFEMSRDWKRVFNEHALADRVDSLVINMGLNVLI